MRTLDPSRSAAPIRVAIVAPTLRILGGHAVQAGQLVEGWQDDPRVRAWLVPINPEPPRWLQWALRIKYVRTLLTQLLYWPRLVSQLRRADAVHVFSASYAAFLLATLPAVVVARLLGRPILVNYHSGEASDHLARSRFARAVLRRVDRLVVPSEFLRDVFARFHLAADVVPNVVDLDRFRFHRHVPLRPRLLSTRNFERLYNVECTLRAFAIVQHTMPAATLTLVGSGSREQSVRAMVRQLGLQHVRFAGRVPPAVMQRYYADAGIYVQTPDIDNMPISVLEAAASGAVIVSTAAGGVPAIVTHEEDGLLVPVGDHRAMADAVLRVLAEPGLGTRLASAARSRCENYGWDVVRDMWLSVYASLAGGPARSVVEAARTNGRLARARAMTWKELRFRARTWITRTRRRAAASVAPPRWRRRSLAAVLQPSDGLVPARSALRARDWTAANRELAHYFAARPSRFVIEPRGREATAAAIRARFPKAEDEARRRADRLLAGRFDLLGYTDLDFADRHIVESSRGGVTIDWHLDPVHHRRARDAWWTRVDYLDPRNGDHKVIWELNRHQHWLALGRAYWLTGNPKYRERFVAELETWLAQNPPLRGINWASMLELAFRALSWLWAIHLFVPETPSAGRLDSSPWLVDLLLGLDRQMRHVEENLSRYFSPNTHLTGEALALYAVGRVLPEFQAAGRWEAIGRQILIEEADRQVAPDGGHAERSTHYHRYTLDFYLLALAVARRTGDAGAEAVFAPLVIRLARFAWSMADGSRCLPLIGDDDAGQLLPLTGNPPSDVGASLSIAASLLPGLIPLEEVTEESLWMTGAATATTGAEPRPLRRRPDEWEDSSAFPHTGYYVSRSRAGDHLVIDAGPMGFLNGGHAHADALSVTLSLRWQPLLIDTGTGTYTMDAAARDRFRSTALHNTLVLDGRNQADPAGPFHWRTTVEARAACWVTNPRFDYFEGQHDGYAPLHHRRAVFAAAGDLWLVVDHVVSSGGDRTPHAASVHWHLHPDWSTRLEGMSIEAVHPSGLHAVLATTAPRLEVFHADGQTGLGWCAPAYGGIVPCAAVRFSRTALAPFSVATVIAPELQADQVRVAPERVDGAEAGHAYAVRVTRPEGMDVAMFTLPRDRAPLGSLGQGGTGELRTPDAFADRHTTDALRFAGFCTDAPFAHVALTTQGRVQAVSLVGATVLQRTTGQPFEIRVAARMKSLAVHFEPDGVVDLFGEDPRPAVTIKVAAEKLAAVRWNNRPVSFERRGNRITVTPEREAASHRSPSPVTVR